MPFTNAVGIPSLQGGKDVNHLKSFLPLAALMHLLDFDKIVSELGVINQTDACVVLKRNQEAVGFSPKVWRLFLHFYSIP